MRAASADALRVMIKRLSGLAFFYPRLLGYVLLLYVLTAQNVSSLLSVVRGADPFMLASALLTSAYIVGAVGLILVKGWARWVVVAAAGSDLLIAVVLGLMEAVFLSSALQLLAIIGRVLFLFSVLVAAVYPRPMPANAQLRKHDYAFASYVFLALASLWGASVFYDQVGLQPVTGPIAETAAAVVGFAIVLPWGLPVAVSLLVGIGLSIALWREWRFWILASFSLVTFWVIWNGPWEYLIVSSLFHGVVSCAFGVWWFSSSRRFLLSETHE